MEHMHTKHFSSAFFHLKSANPADEWCISSVRVMKLSEMRLKFRQNRIAFRVMMTPLFRVLINVLCVWFAKKQCDFMMNNDSYFTYKVYIPNVCRLYESIEMIKISSTSDGELKRNIETWEHTDDIVLVLSRKWRRRREPWAMTSLACVCRHVIWKTTCSYPSGTFLTKRNP